MRFRARAQLRWWSLRNWLRGYKFGPIQRWRCCDHTTPHHYINCPRFIDYPRTARR